jgi:phage baseplate assembly protein W
MAIKIKSLEKIANTYIEQRFIYKDLSLDIAQTKIEAPGYTIPVPGADIKASFDLAAIRNSFQNLFGTVPGQRFLFPTYGLDLRGFLFDPITADNGNSIGTLIYQGISTWENRVRVKNVYVTADPDNHQYIINIIVEVPAFNTTATIESILDVRKQSFQVLPTSRVTTTI